MKKILSGILAMVMICVSSTVAFAKVGDVIGYAKYTDIVAYINHYPIMSYNVNDYTVVVAEDLRNYGFDVAWNQDTRSLNITRSSATTITPYGEVYTYASKLGQNSMPYLETDIKTYVNGKEVPSYNIGGNTVINIEDLRPFGEVVWVPEIRAIKMWIEDLPQTEYKKLRDINTPQKPISTAKDIETFLKWTNLGLDNCTQAIRCMSSFTRYNDSQFKSLFMDFVREAISAFNQAYVIAAKYRDTESAANDVAKIVNILNSMSYSGVTRLDTNNYAGKFSDIVSLSESFTGKIGQILLNK